MRCLAFCGLRAVVLVPLLGGLFALSATAQPPAEVGVMVEVVEQVVGTPSGGSPAPLAVGEPVLLDLAVETGRASFAAMTLGEHGSLQLGPEARLVIDRATVDQATGASDSLLSLLVGKIRLALSSAFRGSLEVDTPTATIGVKGTVFAVDVAPSGDTVVWVIEGEVEVEAKAGGRLRLAAGSFTTVGRGSAPTGPAPFDPESGAAAVRALPPVLGSPDDTLTDPLLGQGFEDLPPDRGDPNGDGSFQPDSTGEPIDTQGGQAPGQNAPDPPPEVPPRSAG